MTVRAVAAGCLAAVAGLGLGWLAGRMGSHPSESPPPVAPAADGVQVEALEREVRSLRQKIDERDLQIATLRRRVDDLVNEQYGSAMKMPESLRVNLPEADGTTSTVEVDLNTIQERMREAMNSPELRELMTSGRRLGVTRMVERRYAALLSSLGLGTEDATRLQELLVERNLESTAGFLPFSDSPARTDDAAASIDEEIRALLGNDGYQAYRRYEETMDARREVNWYERRLYGDDGQLSDGQRDALVQLFHDHGGGPDDAGQLWMRAMAGQPASGGGYDAMLEASLDETQARYQSILIGAGEVLDERQLRTLEGYLNEQIRHREMQAGIASRLLRPALE